MKKPYILFSIVILSSLLTIMMVFVIDSFGWFENGKEALLTNDENCLVMSSSNLEISLDGVNFYNDLNLDITDSLADVTSDGYNFYYPRELNSNDDVNMDDYDNLILLDSSSTDFKNYVKEIDLTFKATEKLDVYLSASSFIEGREALTGNNITRLSPFAITSNFSSDAISGAIRVAIFEYVDEYLILSTKSREYKLLVSAGYEITDYEEVKNQGIFYTSDGLTKTVSFFNDEDLADVIKVRSNTLELKELWIPNDRYQINIAGGSGTFNEFGTRETFRGYANTNYGYLYKTNGVIVAKAYDASDYAKFITVGSNHLSLVNQISYINEAKRIISFNTPNELSYKKIKIRIWFEGTDRECTLALASGEVKYQLSFYGINKDENLYLYNDLKNTQHLLDNEDVVSYNYATNKFSSHFNNILNDNSNIEVSLNGIDYTDYNSNYDYTINGFVYLRLKETNSTYPSNAVIIYTDGR